MSEHSDTDRPSTCGNPEADCYREPTKNITWVEDYTADEPRWSGWLCEPCWKMVQQGTKLSPNETEVVRSVDTDTEQ